MTWRASIWKTGDVDEMALLEDRDLLEAMGLAAQTLGLLFELSGAARLAAIQVHDLPG
jgi:threonine dehydratase